MSGPGFTPGPWCVGPSREHDYSGLKMWTVSVNVGEVTNHGNQIASVQLGGDGATSSDRESVFANARLIATAPELYEALLDARAIIAGALSADYPLWIERADAALAKARGETP